MKVCLKKCNLAQFHSPKIPFTNEDFSGNHIDHKEPICDWCAAMWYHFKCHCNS